MWRRGMEIMLGVWLCIAMLGTRSSAQERASQPASAGSLRRTRALAAVRASTNIVIDGRFDESAWTSAPVADSFVQRAPVEGRPSTERTEVRMLYDDDALYVAASLFDSR